jgi:hypothetical protein
VDERVLTPTTSVLTVLVVGMVAGHVLMPARPGAGLAAQAEFVAAVAATGALGGWRTGRVFGRRGSWRIVVAVAAGALLALGLAGVAYVIVHGA